MALNESSIHFQKKKFFFKEGNLINLFLEASIFVILNLDRIRNGNCTYFSFQSIDYAKSLQLCPTLCDPIDGSPPGSPVPGILQARTLEWVAKSQIRY